MVFGKGNGFGDLVDVGVVAVVDGGVEGGKDNGGKGGE